MERVSSVITQIEPHDSVERYTNLGVECMQGDARIESPWNVVANGKKPEYAKYHYCHGR